jgi:hypothetical protein
MSVLWVVEPTDTNPDIASQDHQYPLFHIYWLENFLDDGCHALFSLFQTTNEHFVVTMQKLQFHYDYFDILLS